MADGIRAVVLAAGQGRRMRSAQPKVLHRLAGRTLVDHVIEVAATVTGRRPIVVVSPAFPEVAGSIAAHADAVVQSEPRGTGDALRSVPDHLREKGTVLVLSGDVPLLRPGTLRRLLHTHVTSGASCTLLTMIPSDPKGFGRVVRNAEGVITNIVEERDLGDAGYNLPECNAAVYAFDSARLWPALERLTTNNAQGEYYLTDVIAHIGGLIKGVQTADTIETMGINDRVDLAAAATEVRRRIVVQHMLAGVTVEDPASAYIDAAVRIGEDTVIAPMTVLTGDTVIGTQCRIGPSANLRNVQVGARVHFGASTAEDSVVGDDVRIGPYNRIRPGSELRAGVRIGTHAEVKNSTVGEGSRIGHFSCVLDSDVGREVNIGAGSVTTNYDGEAKHRTVIGDRVFVGSGSLLVAPLTIGSDAFIAAGSTIVEDVEAGALAVERAAQRNVPGWVAERRRRRAEASTPS